MIPAFHINLEKAKMKSNKNSASIVCYSFTSSGKIIGEKIKEHFCISGKTETEHFCNSEIQGGIKSLVQNDFKNKNALIFISSTGIAIRMIKNYIEDKTTDPAVIVIDDMGKYIIPILSGHIGGANELAKTISKIIGGQAIITTASDARNIEAVDIFAKRNNYAITAMEDAKKITAYMVEGKRIILYSDCTTTSSILNSKKIIQYPNLIVCGQDLWTTKNGIEKNIHTEMQKASGIIIVSENACADLPKELYALNLPCVKLVPRTINLGIGLRRGIAEAVIRSAAEKALGSIGKSIYAVNKIGSIDIKKDEAGLIAFAKHLKTDLIFFTKEEIEKVENKFSKSEFVKQTVGVYNVSAPAAFLLGGNMVIDKFTYEGVTVSAAEVSDM